MQAKGSCKTLRTYKLELLLCALLLVAVLPMHRAPRPLEQTRKAAPEVLLQSTTALPIRPVFRRPVLTKYRYSVIPGGAYSTQQFEAALADDPVVRAHYVTFDTTMVRMERTQGARFMYTSYRKGDSVYWTNHRVRVAANEMLITDGSNLARARCGNRLSEKPQLPVAATEPAASELDVLEAPPEVTGVVLTNRESPSPFALFYDLFPPDARFIFGSSPAETGDGAGSTASSGNADYIVYAMPKASEASMSPIVSAELSDLAPNQRPLIDAAWPFGGIELFPTDAPVDWQTLQIWNSGSLDPVDLSYGLSGFAIGDTPGRLLTTQASAGPSFLSPTIPLSGSWGNLGLVGLGGGAVPSSMTLTATEGQNSPIDINLVGPVQNAPESDTSALIGIGSLGVAWMLRRSRRRQAI